MKKQTATNPITRELTDTTLEQLINGVVQVQEITAGNENLYFACDGGQTFFAKREDFNYWTKYGIQNRVAAGTVCTWFAQTFAEKVAYHHAAQPAAPEATAPVALAVARVVEAWVNKGRAPFIHEHAKKQLRISWATLAHAVENLVAVVHQMPAAPDAEAQAQAALVAEAVADEDVQVLHEFCIDLEAVPASTANYAVQTTPEQRAALLNICHRLETAGVQVKSRTAKIELTRAELEAVNLCLGNGYGDGDFDEYMNNKIQSNALARGWDKLRTAEGLLRQQNGGQS